ncbi:recombinase family protein [Aliiroseovarius sp. S1339]|uniref:recombinase family protein n=1 Tax=Aliiroseovarius sp. S1339 TaxID=2936990 RepID=UPI0020BF0D58|nr:recombinase family protein [Aliiroseovarius sp. S1339]MCK8465203.1 recombinase family protein [Aliiroseovarius sp. S1339]
MKKTRCAIYTRKSSEDGLEQEFNSLDAQREACAAFIASQKIEGWVLVPDAYDDGGLSGGTLERPGLQRLMADVRSGKVDRIVVYKIDRLTRSLGDFAKIVEVLDEAGGSFVSVTQSFNTSTSMGRLTLNMLLSFAQFEREVTAERIRDKIAASKKKGLWMGGNVPLGYEPDGRTLKVKEPDAQIIRTIYDLYKEHGTVRKVKDQADRLGLKTAIRTLSSGRLKGGTPFSFGHIYYILTNPVYTGRIRHKTNVYPGQHAPLIEPELWDALQDQLMGRSVSNRLGKERGQGRGGRKQASLLIGKLFDETGDRLTPSHTKSSKGHRLRYYVSNRLIRSKGAKDPSGWRLPGPELETLVATLLRKHLGTPAVTANIVSDPTTEETAAIAKKLAKITGTEANEHNEKRSLLLPLCHRIQIKPGQIKISMSPENLAEILDVASKRVSEECLEIDAAFQHRKRGVETKLVLSDTTSPRDETLFKNIAKAHHYFNLIRAGKTYAEIAASEGVSKHRVYKLVDLAFLAPDVLRDVFAGSQPTGLTSEWLLRHAIPALWDEQREVFRTL